MPGDLPGPADVVAQMLFVQRVVLISGPVDTEQAARTAASLMALDAIGDDPVECRINASSDSMEAAFTLIDTIDALGVRFVATAAGMVAGTMVGVLAVCQKRRITPSARVELREPTDCLSGLASRIETHAQALDGRWHLYLHRLAEATGRPFEHLESAHRTGTFLTAAQAVTWGLADEVASPGRR